MRPLHTDEIGDLKRTQAKLALAKRATQEAIDEVSALAAKWLDSGDLDAHFGAVALRSDLQDALTKIQRGHNEAGRRLTEIFSDGDMIVQGGGGGR